MHPHQQFDILLCLSALEGNVERESKQGTFSEDCRKEKHQIRNVSALPKNISHPTSKKKYVLNCPSLCLSGKLEFQINWFSFLSGTEVLGILHSFFFISNLYTFGALCSRFPFPHLFLSMQEKKNTIPNNLPYSSTDVMFL